MTVRLLTMNFRAICCKVPIQMLCVEDSKDFMNEENKLLLEFLLTVRCDSEGNC